MKRKYPELFDFSKTDTESIRFVKEYLTSHNQSFNRVSNEKDDEARKIKKMVMDETEFASDSFYTFTTRLYFFLNGYKDFPKCSRCGKPITKFNLRKISEPHKFTKFCSDACRYDNADNVKHKKDIAVRNVKMSALDDCSIKKQLELLIEKHPFNYVTHINAKDNWWSFLRDWIMAKTSNLDEHYTMHTRIGWILNDYKEFPKCQCPTCTNTFEGRNISRGTFRYPMFCSQKCECNTQSIKDKMAKTKNTTFGDRTLARKKEIAFEKSITSSALCDDEKILIIKEIIRNNPNNFGRVLKSSCAFGKSDDNSYLIRFIESKTPKLTDSVYSLKTKIYWILNGLDDFPKCKVCGKPIMGKNVKTIDGGFPTHCSYKCVVHDKDAFEKSLRKYVYNGEVFHSSWELAYFIWLTDNNISFEYHPKDGIPYVHNGKTHYYFPDFKIGNDIVEIKGNHFFDSDGNLINPYDIDDGISKSKHECMKMNNVKVLKYSDIKESLDYVAQKYGVNYLQSFKNK